jgi:dihydrofolate reductase
MSARLVYSVICSLDGYAADEAGTFDWAAPDEEVHRFINDLQRPVGTHLYGRRMYETMAVWQTMGGPGEHPVETDYADIWRAADKIVYSTTLDEVTTPRTRLERRFDMGAVSELKRTASADLSIGGPGLAADAIGAGLVDEYQVFLIPVVVGGGLPALPPGVRRDLALVDERRFAGGTVLLRYRDGAVG